MISIDNFEDIELRCVCEDVLFHCFLDKGFFSPGVMQYEPHAHAQYELHIVEKGKYVLEELWNEKKNIVKEGMFAIISPNCYHNAFFFSDASAGENDIERFVLRIEFERVKNHENGIQIYDRFESSMLNINKGIFCFNSPEIVKAASLLYSEIQKSGKIRYICANAYLKLCMALLVNEVIRSDNVQEKNQQIEKAETVLRKNKIEKFLEDKYSDPDFDLNMLMAHLNLSRSQTSRIIKEYYGVSFNRFLADFRLARAEKMLLRTNMTIEKISEKIGYGSPNGFFIAFKKKYGTSPGEFRKQMSLD